MAGVSGEDIDNTRYVKAQPAIADLELFDAKFFRYTQREAEVTDPQHRLFLETAYVALEDFRSQPVRGAGRGRCLRRQRHELLRRPPLAAWRSVSRGAFACHVLPGGHFFTQTALPTVVRRVVAALGA